MKTVEELAKEYAINSYGTPEDDEYMDINETSFIDEIVCTYIKAYTIAEEIYKKKLEWISVEDELPAIRDYDYQILTKYKNNTNYKTWKIFADDDDFKKEEFLTHNITHWRYID